MTPRKTAADYAAIAVAPVLIFLMISSLANLLMLILYRGGFPQRVSWTLLCFTMGAVAIARIAIERDRAYSLAYAGALGLATFVVMLGLVDSMIFSAFILLVIAYLADLIVRDCTLIEDDVDASGQGLIDSGTLFLKKQIQPDSDPETEPDTSSTKRKAHQPGRTVMYLALGALPLFGLGQFLMRNDPDTWLRAQRLLAFYLFASLSLLVTTSFLGLRRYLRQRKVEMPGDVSVAWLTGGLGMIAAVLFIAYIAPMPGRAIASFELPHLLDSPGDTTASSAGWGDEGVDHSNPDAPPTSNDPNAEGKEVQSTTVKKGAPAGDVGDGNRKDGPTGKQKGGKKPQSSGSSDPQSSSKNPQDENAPPQSGSGKKQGNEPQQSEQSQPKQSQSKQSQSKQSQSKQSQSDDGESGESSESSDSPGQESQDSAQSEASQSESNQSNGDSPGDESDSRESGESSDENASEESAGEENASEEDSSEESSPKESGESRSSSSNNSNTASPPDSSDSSSRASGKSSVTKSLSNAMSTAASLIKFIVFLVLAGIVVTFLWMNRHLISQWWQQLFDKEREPEDAAFEEFLEEVTQVPPRAFASFRNPIGKESDVRRVVVITFQAFEAWTRERGTPRGKDETPAEFIRRVSPAEPQVSAPATQVVNAYNRIVYGRGNATQSDLAAADQVWRAMRGRS